MQHVTANAAMRPHSSVFGVVLSVSIVIVLGLGFASVHTNLLLSDTNSAAAALNIGVLVFREGLECVLVLAAIATGAAQTRQSYQRAIAVGAGVGFAATLVTWNIAVRILSSPILATAFRSCAAGGYRTGRRGRSSDRDELVFP